MQLPKLIVQTISTIPRGYTDTLHRSALEHWSDLAVEDLRGSYTYGDIYIESLKLCNAFKEIDYQRHKTVALLLPSDVSFVISLWALWISSLIAVPLFPPHPEPQLKYYVENSKSHFIITSGELVSKCLNIFPKEKILLFDDVCDVTLMEKDRERNDDKWLQIVKETNNNLVNDLSSNSMILYTSGSTGPPKGVVLSHGNIHSQVACLRNAWEWTSHDVILHCLPLNHTHGIVNALLCPLFSGAKVVLEPSFNASSVWSKLLNLDSNVFSRINVFMAVPSIYVKLIEEYQNNLIHNIRRKDFIREICKENIRLMVSGSASLPVSVFEKWHEITGHTLLERYGMTEIGMALSNPLHGIRMPGFVGTPLPGVYVKIARFSPKRDCYISICDGSTKGTVVTSGMENEDGELLVKGSNVFQGYWENRNATEKEFTKDGWFCTGDTAAYIDGSYKILGRTSVDIIKTGGFKVSALDIERELLLHPNVIDIAVVGVPDITWGEKVAAVIYWNKDIEFSLPEFRSWAKKRIPHYQVPSVVKVLAENIPRNSMGKVNKKELIKLYF